MSYEGMRVNAINMFVRAQADRECVLTQLNI